MDRRAQANAGGAAVNSQPASVPAPANAGIRAAAAGATVAASAGSAANTNTPAAAVAVAGAGAGSAQGSAGSGASQAPPSAEPTGPLFPANGADNICPDLSLHLRFDEKPSLGSGKISVFEKGSSTPVASVDVSTAQAGVTRAGTQLTFVQPVFVVDREVVVQLPAALDYNKSYYVTVDASAVRGAGGVMPLGGEANWSFSTRAAPPTDPSQLRVALDGTGDYCAVQTALEAAAKGATISLGRGYYHELIHVSGKSGVTLRGDDRKASVILGVNNENLNGGTAKRALVNIEKSSDLTIERLTIHNLTEQGGSQAEALRLQDCDKCVVREADILSLQDTLLWNGRIYAKDCYVAGNVDFVWGTGGVFFDHCEIKTVGRKGYVVQSRNAADGYGYVFVDSKISADAGVSGILLGRIDVSVYPGSHVAYINCEMGNHIAPEGWTVTGGAAGASLRFWEYQSTTEGGAALDVSRRHASSTQISADQAATMRDPSKVLGGWVPPQ
jgi:pectin methylesterase-like acyl-CoA thioesterase